MTTRPDKVNPTGNEKEVTRTEDQAIGSSLQEAGMPDGVINMIPVSGGQVGNPAMARPDLAGGFRPWELLVLDRPKSAKMTPRPPNQNVTIERRPPRPAGRAPASIQTSSTIHFDTVVYYSTVERSRSS